MKDANRKLQLLHYWSNDTPFEIELFLSIVLSSRVTNSQVSPTVWVIKSQQRFQFTLQDVGCKANIRMAIHTLVLTSDSFSYNCNSIHLLCVNWLQRTSHPFSYLFRRVYINQCKFHMLCLIPRSSSTCTACTTMYYRFFNIWNQLLKCTYIHLSLFHSNVSNIQQHWLSAGGGVYPGEGVTAWEICCPGGVYLGGCLLRGCLPREVSAYETVCLGVSAYRGVHFSPSAHGQNSWHMLMKTLSFCNFVCRQ